MSLEIARIGVCVCLVVGVFLLTLFLTYAVKLKNAILLARIDTLTSDLAEARARIAELTKQRDTFMRGLEADAEECNELHAEIDELKAKVERRSAPVTAHEWQEHSFQCEGEHVGKIVADRMDVDELILARRAQGGTK